MSGPGIGVGCCGTAASVSEGWAADATLGAVTANPAAAAAWKKSRRPHPVVLLFILDFQSID
jgi:hypothetical protein